MARKSKKEEEEKKEAEKKAKRLKVLESSFEMYENSKNEASKRRENAKDKFGGKMYSDESTVETIELMETMQKDIIDEYTELGGNPENLKALAKNNVSKSNTESKRDIMRKKMLEIIAEEQKELERQQEANEIVEETIEETPKETFEVDKDVKVTHTKKQSKTPVVEEVKNETTDDTSEGGVFTIGDVRMNIAEAEGKNIKYDVIPLPSKGKPYKHKIGKIPVAYLTAYDENMIMSPNMYNDGTFLSNILRNKIMTSKVNPDELLPGDREAILVWLRASGYGPIYPITAKDRETGKEFKTEFDLSDLKYRPFELESDDEGCFTFVMPITKDVIKFKFLSYNDLKELIEETTTEDREIKRKKLQDISASLKDILEGDTEIGVTLKSKVERAIEDIDEYGMSIKEGEDIEFNHLVTNRMIKSIVSVNGVTDMSYIEEYVTYLNIKDANAFRTYIAKNEPGLDMNIKVKRPKSLGGGSSDLFLQLDQWLFLNV